MSTWILLRGLGRDARHWGDFPTRLSAALPGATILAPDLPGNGARHGETSATRVAAMTDRLRAELAATGRRPPYRLLALSLGAMVALDWAARHPHELAGAVLINTSLRGLSPPPQRLRPAALATLLRAWPGSVAGREAAILRLTSRRRRSPAEAAAIVACWTQWQRACPVSASNLLRQLLAAARFGAPPAAPPVPLLVLAGAADRLVDPACSRRLARHWGAAFAEHPWAGHDLPLDDAPWVATAVTGWLAQLASG